MDVPRPARRQGRPAGAGIRQPGDERERACGGEFAVEKELGAGVIDIKSFYQETPEDVAERIRELLQYVPPEKLYVSPDCGFFQLPRWLTYVKLEAMVAGAAIVRREIEGADGS